MKKLKAVLGALGLAVVASGPTSATAATYIIDGTFSGVLFSCTQITFAFSGSDCSYGRNRPAANGTWLGPLFSGANYPKDSLQATVTYLPTSGDNVPQGSSAQVNFIPAVPDGKLNAPLDGELIIDDNGTPGDPTDDIVSGSFTIGALARNVPTGQFTRAVQQWTTMDNTIVPTPVNPTATVANGAGGVDYVVGSRGFPTPRCYRYDAANCFPTEDAMPDFGDARFWGPIPPAGSVGIERSGILGDPAFVPVQPPPLIPTGNVGASTTATFTGASCATNNGAVDDCAVSSLIWGAGEDPGFDNLIMKISTNSSGQITSALVYWTQEYFIGAFSDPILEVGYNNSFQASTFSFTGFRDPTEPTDATPDPFTFVSQVNVPVSMPVTSAPVTITGINTAAPISVTGGAYSIGCTATFTTSQGSILDGQTVCVRQTSSALPATAKAAVLTVGGVLDAFIVTTGPPDAIPDPFAFVDKLDVQEGTVITSAPVSITGINTPAPISVLGGTYSVGCGANFTGVPGTIGVGLSVCVRHTSAISQTTATNTTLTIGGVSDTFTSTTVVTFATRNDSATTLVNTPVQINVLGNDIGYANPVTVSIATPPIHGTALVTGSPGVQSGVRITYTPAPGFQGADTFAYAVDDSVLSGTATVTVTVTSDADGDGVLDSVDNCLGLSNTDQRDTNGDGYGNICDADFNNNGIVDSQDGAVLKARFGSATHPDQDLNGNGIVDSNDGARLKAKFGKAPGPSGLAP